MAITWKKLSFEDSVLLLDGTQAMTGALDMGTQKINNVVDPALDQDAATKKYVDSLGVANLDYVPQATSGDYTVPTGQSFICGDVFSIEGANTLSLEGTAQMIIIG